MSRLKLMCTESKLNIIFILCIPLSLNHLFGFLCLFVDLL